MLSIVPLMNGGGLFETGAGGSAPKHVQQLVQGEPPALGLARRVPRAGGLVRDARRRDRQPARGDPGRTLDEATGQAARERQVAVAQVNELDNRGSALLPRAVLGAGAGRPVDDPELGEAFAPLAERLAADEETIVGELDEVQGESVDLGGYYFVDREKADAVMRPSETFNAAIDDARAA